MNKQKNVVPLSKQNKKDAKHVMYCLCTPFGVSQVVCGVVHFCFLAWWAMWLFSQWALHWWRVNSNTVCELFPCTHPWAQGWTGHKHCFSSLRYDSTWNWTLLCWCMHNQRYHLAGTSIVQQSNTTTQKSSLAI